MTNKVGQSITETEAKISEVSHLLKLSKSLQREEADSALKHAQHAESLAKSIPYPTGVIEALSVQADAYHTLADFSNAFRVANAALEAHQNNEPNSPHPELANRIALLHTNLGNYAKSLKILFEALDYFQKISDEKNQAKFLRSIGFTYTESGKPHLAIKFDLKSLELYQRLGNDRDLAHAHINCSWDYRLMNDYDEAQMHAEQAVYLYKQLGDDYGMGVSIGGLGKIAFDKKDYATAINYFKEAISLSIQNRSDIGSLDTIEFRFDLARAYYRSQQPEHALQSIQAGLAFTEQRDLHPYTMTGHKLLSEIYEGTGNLSAALTHLKKHLEARERVFTIQNERELQNLQILYETKEAVAESERLKGLRQKDQKHFQNLTQIKDEFLHNATHDIKNPLSVINTSTHILKLKYSDGDPTFHKHLERISYQSHRIRQLVEDMLDLTKLETISTNNIQAVSIAKLLQDCKHRLKPLIDAKKISINTTTNPQNLIGYVDANRLEKAIENILSNAIKYTQAEGAIYLTAEASNTQLQIQIRDTGFGIPQEAIPHIFDRFYRVREQSQAANIEGTGLGLSIAKLSVEQHGGTIKVDSQVDVGTTFSIQLPQ